MLGRGRSIEHRMDSSAGRCPCRRSTDPSPHLRRPRLSESTLPVVLEMILSGTPMLDPATDGARCAETIHARTVDALYRSHHRLLVCYLRARLPSHEDAEELAQEAFARVLALDDMSCIENLEGYLFCVATNLVMERARRRHVRDRHEQDAYLEQVMPEPEPEHAARSEEHTSELQALMRISY